MNNELFFASGAVMAGLELNENDQVISIYGNAIINGELSKNSKEIIVLEKLNSLPKNANYVGDDSIMLEGAVYQLYELLTIATKLSKANKVYLGREIKDANMQDLRKVINFLTINSIFYFAEEPTVHTPSLGLIYQADLMAKARSIYPDVSPYIFKKVREGTFQ